MPDPKTPTLGDLVLYTSIYSFANRDAQVYKIQGIMTMLLFNHPNDDTLFRLSGSMNAAIQSYEAACSLPPSMKPPYASASSVWGNQYNQYATIMSGIMVELLTWFNEYIQL